MEFLSTNNDSSQTMRIKKGNEHFKYSSFLRLRNLIFLCLLLKKNPTLRKFRYHYLKEQAEKHRRNNLPHSESLGQYFGRKLNYEKYEVTTFGEFVDKRISKKLNKIKEKIKNTITESESDSTLADELTSTNTTIESEAEPMVIQTRRQKVIQELNNSTVTSHYIQRHKRNASF
jgi:hypothetical protein